MLRVDRISVDLDQRRIVDDVDLNVSAGETLAVLGPSGCGKTTLLRAIAGLQRPSRGRVFLAEHDVTQMPAHRRGVGLMFQDNTLFPHRDVGANVAFGLRMARVPVSTASRRVAELLDLVGLSGAVHRSIETLSGGEQQRVALARALAPEPRVLLLDEPLGSLDASLRDRLLAELKEIFERLRLAVVYVTHDVGEAFFIGHRVAVMRTGRMVQQATPDELWSRPADAWVARFLGMGNVEERNGIARVTRPEAIRCERLADGEATIVRAERAGALVHLHALLTSGREIEAVTTDIDHPMPGERVTLRIDPAGVIEVPLWEP